MSLSAATLDRQMLHFEIGDVNPETSIEVSQLLLRAMTFVEQDEAIAIFLIRTASSLMRPFARQAEKPARNPIAPGGLAPWQVRRLKAFILERISHSISIDELAQLVRLSSSYFSAAFKVSFGTSPHNYVIAQRVEAAKQRMLDSDAPLSEIALDCGLADQAHLSRLFRRMTGATPSAWRRYSQNASVAMAS